LQRAVPGELREQLADVIEVLDGAEEFFMEMVIEELCEAKQLWEQFPRDQIRD